MPIPKERLFALIDASQETIASIRATREAYHQAIAQRLSQSITEPQAFQLISDAFDFHTPSPAAFALIQQEYVWRITTGARNEYRKLWMQQHRVGQVAEAASGLASRGLSREEILAEFRRENNLPDPSTITLEGIGLAEPSGSAPSTTSTEDDQS